MNIGRMERRYGVQITIENEAFFASRDGVVVASAITLDELEIALLMM